ncbi:MAG: fatty acid-binding protein DegV [Epulopiscium sp. Nele67-Bin001]|nr:MAG: fatty acid-binding protein DegV [Epulopiscium sp. Nele67-Bin001]
MIAVLADSACDLPKAVLDQYKIYTIPMSIIYKDKEYLDQVTITPQEVYDKMATEVPTTSLPDREYGLNVLKQIEDEGYTDVLVVTISNVLSGTPNAIRILSEEYPSMRFHFFDTKTLGVPEGVVVREAAKLVSKGLPINTVLKQLEEIRTRIKGYILVDTLEYLIKGGRLSKTAGAVGTVLNLKPIVSHNEEGKLYTHAKPRGKKQSRKQLKEILEEHLKQSSCEVWVLHAASKPEADEFLESIKDLGGITEIHSYQIGAAMGVHTGPQTIGVVVFNSK